MTVASATPGAGRVPIAGSGGKLDAGYIPSGATGAALLAAATQADGKAALGLGAAALLDQAQNWTAQQTFGAGILAYGPGFDGGAGIFESSTAANSVTIKGVDSPSTYDVAYLLLHGGANEKRWVQGLTGTASTSGDLRWLAGNDAGGYDERMRLTNAGSLGIGLLPVAGAGLLQLASGTTQANGIAFGGVRLYRSGAGYLTLASTESTDPVLWAVSSSGPSCIFGADAGSGLFGTTSAHELALRTSNSLRIRIAPNGYLHFGGGAPVAPMSLPAAATDAATTQALANALRAGLIAYGLAA